MDKYMIINGGRKTLAERVNKSMEEGYIPSGGIANFGEDGLCQAMVLDVPLVAVQKKEYVSLKDITVIGYGQDTASFSLDVNIRYKYKDEMHHCAE